MTDVPDFEIDETIEGYEADLRELRAHLSAAEQDAKNGWKAFADAVKVVDEQKALVFAAEARAEAAERALRDILDLLPSGEYSRAVARIARDALAGREETGTPEVISEFSSPLHPDVIEHALQALEGSGEAGTLADEARAALKATEGVIEAARAVLDYEHVPKRGALSDLRTALAALAGREETGGG